MQYADIIAREANFLPVEKQAKALDFIEFLKDKQARAGKSSEVRTPEEIAAFFRSFNVDTSGYKFDREEANARLHHS